jgi:uncharacterized protein DUF5320
MPSGDGTGPNGQGPLTGRRGGRCVSKAERRKILQEEKKGIEVMLKELE